ncbi:MAG TPA: Crp/Fnr family transcriptional regulator [Anaerolineales bacterium]|nr:Crp/Fnr family transcriptional regulator [Anaerolineales bacterium]
MDTVEEITAELQKIPWFQELKQEHVQKLASISKIRRVKAGEVIFREGDTHESVYIVLEGRVGLEMFVPHRGKVRFYTAEPWEVFGWSSVTPNVHLRTAGATAVLDGAVLRIDAEKLSQACDEDHTLGYLVMRRLAHVVAGRLLVTRLQLLDMFANPETKNV